MKKLQLLSTPKGIIPSKLIPPQMVRDLMNRSKLSYQMASIQYSTREILRKHCI